MQLTQQEISEYFLYFHRFDKVFRQIRFDNPVKIPGNLMWSRRETAEGKILNENVRTSVSENISLIFGFYMICVLVDDIPILIMRPNSIQDIFNHKIITLTDYFTNNTLNETINELISICVRFLVDGYNNETNNIKKSIENAVKNKISS